MLKCFCLRSVGWLGVLALVCSQSSGALYVVPSANSSTEGNSSDNAPLGSSEQHFQQAFSSTLLNGIPGSSQIVGIAFRVNGGLSAVPAQTVTTFDIRMSQSANAPGSLVATFALNRGADDILVRSGPLVINVNQFPGGSTPNGFGIIPFDTPYEYTGGNLLIEVAYKGFTTGRDADAVYPITGTLAQTAFGTGYNSTTADLGLYNEAIVFGFDVEPLAPVPEPVQTGLMAVGALGAVVTAKHLRIRVASRPTQAN